MAPKKPLTKLTTNTNAYEYYIQSKAQNKYFIKKPEWDVARDDIAMNAISHERNNAEVYRMQYEMREQAKAAAKQNVQRAQELHDLQLKLRDKFIETNELVRKCEEKERNAERCIAVEREKNKQLNDDIDQISAELKTLTDFQSKFENAIDDLKPYENILDEVVAKSKLFKSKKDVLDRCDALLLAQVEVAEGDEINQRLTSDAQNGMAKIANEAMHVITKLSNELSILEKNYKRRRSESLKWESILGSGKDTITDSEKLSFVLLDQIQQLYLLLCKRNHQKPKFTRKQIKQQIDFIAEELDTIQEVIRLSNDMMAKETRSDIAQCASTKSDKRRSH